MQKEEIYKMRGLSVLEWKSQVLHELFLWNEESRLQKQGWRRTGDKKYIQAQAYSSNEIIVSDMTTRKKIITYIFHFNVNIPAQQFIRGS